MRRPQGLRRSRRGSIPSRTRSRRTAPAPSPGARPGLEPQRSRRADKEQTEGDAADDAMSTSAAALPKTAHRRRAPRTAPRRRRAAAPRGTARDATEREHRRDLRLAVAAQPSPARPAASPPSSSRRRLKNVITPVAEIHVTTDPTKNSPMPGLTKSPAAAVGPTPAARTVPHPRPRIAAPTIPVAASAGTYTASIAAGLGRLDEQAHEKRRTRRTRSTRTRAPARTAPAHGPAAARCARRGAG